MATNLFDLKTENKRNIAALLGVCVVLLATLLSIDKLDLWLTIALYLIAISIPLLCATWGIEEYAGVVMREPTARRTCWVGFHAVWVAVILVFAHFSIWAALLFVASTVYSQCVTYQYMPDDVKHALEDLYK